MSGSEPRRRIGPAGIVGALVMAGLLCVLAACAGPGPFVRMTVGPVASVAVDQAEASALVSDYRRAHGLVPVASDPVLGRVAQAQAEAMASADQLSHTVAGSLPTRLAPYDRSHGASVENVSAGYADLAAALSGWRRSPEHNENLLYAPMRHIGVAAATAAGTRYKTFWALVMTD